MHKIGFKNFRRFLDFKPIEFKGLTFLVGRNNSGKSTLVKALLLSIDYLKADTLPTLSFNQNNVEDVNIVTFERALNKSANLKKEEFIEFHLEIDGFRFHLTVTGKKDSTNVDVINLSIEDLNSGFSFLFKPQQSDITISTNTEGIEIIPENEEKLFIELDDRKEEITKNLKNINQKTSPEYIELNNELKQVKKKMSDLRKAIKSAATGGQFNLTTHYNTTSLKDAIQDAVKELSAEYDVQYHDIQKGKKPKKIFESLKAFKDNKFKIEKSAQSLFDFIKQVEIVYLGATLNKQSALFAIRDSRNPLAQAIHEYKQLGIDSNQGSDAYKFVKNWIADSEFDIGESLNIKMYAGESYEVTIKSHSLEIPLADKGMGSIQAMLLILRLAVIIHKKQTIDRLNKVKPEEGKLYIVIIEEPELNLHPALQSKLADLFHDVHNKYKIRLIIETHSEYLIRRTQLIVKQNEYEVAPNENPLSVLYFDKEMKQWPMRYREDGKFIDEFGKGFYDESAKLTLNLL